MFFEEYGEKAHPTILFLHGANFVHTFGRQYELASRFHLLVPHITGFGKEAETTFTVERAVGDLVNLLQEQKQPILLVGMSLGAQLGFYLLSKHPSLIRGAILISPWLLKSSEEMPSILERNIKQFRSLQNRRLCNIIGRMNGLPKEPRKEFVEQMQKVSIETIQNAVDNGITLDALPEYRNVEIPILALAGSTELGEILRSVKALSVCNPNCAYQIWEKASHNIPPVFAKRLNQTIVEFFASIL